MDAGLFICFLSGIIKRPPLILLRIRFGGREEVGLIHRYAASKTGVLGSTLGLDVLYLNRVLKTGSNRRPFLLSLT